MAQPASQEGKDMKTDQNGNRQASDRVVFTHHPMRARVLQEIHARPFVMTTAPRRFVHLAFMTEGKKGQAAQAAFQDYCLSRGVSAPLDEARHHRVRLGPGQLRWERHNEFTTYTWDFEPDTATDFEPFEEGLQQPGPLLAAARIDVYEGLDVREDVLRRFDQASLCISVVEKGAAQIASDFRQDAAGLTRMAVFAGDLHEAQLGALVQRLLEIETYRVLTLMGLPDAQSMSQILQDIESQLRDITANMRTTRGLVANRTLLHRLMELAAELEAAMSTRSYRFSASQAYAEIVNLRLDVIHEESRPGWSLWSTFLVRRIRPAITTIKSMDFRQLQLAKKLNRATTLLHTRVDIEQEEQSRKLLQSMNQRARLQLRLQQTVEGLSVAAISYYIVSLVGYVIKGAKGFGFGLKADALIGLAVPLVLGGIWYAVRRIRSHHQDLDEQ